MVQTHIHLFNEDKMSGAYLSTNKIIFLFAQKISPQSNNEEDAKANKQFECQYSRWRHHDLVDSSQ